MASEPSDSGAHYARSKNHSNDSMPMQLKMVGATSNGEDKDNGDNFGLYVSSTPYHSNMGLFII